MAGKKKAVKKTSKKIVKRAAAKKTTAKKTVKPAAAKAKPKAPEASAKEIAEALAEVATVRAPDIPVDKLTGEARTLVVAAKRDAEALAKVGVKRSLIAIVASLSAIVSKVQSQILAARKVGRTKAEIATDVLARAFRQRTLEDLAFATDGDADAALRIAAIREGEGVDDLIADLGVIVAFIREIPDQLKRIGQNPQKLVQEGTALEAKLGALVDERRTRSDETALTTERDRAATALSAAMAKLRSAGKYAFRDEPNKARLYTSTYTRVRKAVYRAKQTKAKKAAAKKPQQSSEE